MPRKHCGLRIKSQMRDTYLSYQKKQMGQENACTFLYEIHRFVEIYFVESPPK